MTVVPGEDDVGVEKEGISKDADVVVAAQLGLVLDGFVSVDALHRPQVP